MPLRPTRAVVGAKAGTQRPSTRSSACSWANVSAGSATSTTISCWAPSSSGSRATTSRADRPRVAGVVDVTASMDGDVLLDGVLLDGADADVATVVSAAPRLAGDLMPDADPLAGSMAPGVLPPPHAAATTVSASAPNRSRTRLMLARGCQIPRAALSKRV
jgi:hypothetical protein